MPAVRAQATAVTVFVGSLFFTVASYLAFLQVVRQDGHAWFAWKPAEIGYWACLVQLVCTLYFSVTTFAALLDVPPDMVDRIIWRPDAIGSVCFLVASALAFAEAGTGGGRGVRASATGTSPRSTRGGRCSSACRPSALTSSRRVS